MIFMDIRHQLSVEMISIRRGQSQCSARVHFATLLDLEGTLCLYSLGAFASASVGILFLNCLHSQGYLLYLPSVYISRR